MLPDLLSDWPWMSWLAGAVMIVLGTALCFKGRHFLKPLLGILGAGIGALTGIRIADKLATNSKLLFNDPRWHYVAVVGCCSGVLAVVSVMVWKAALALLSGAVGYTVATAVESISPFNIGDFLNNSESDYLYYGYYGLSILLPMSLIFLPDRWLVPVISGLTGGGLAVLGVDLFVDSGLLSLVSSSVTSMRVPSDDHVSEPIMHLLMAWILLSSAGLVYQLFFDSDKYDEEEELVSKQHIYFEDI